MMASVGLEKSLNAMSFNFDLQALPNYGFNFLTLLFQISTNAQWTWANVTKMQIVQTLMERTIVLARKIIMEMDSTAQVI